MNKKRLLKLADFLETVPAEAFDIVEWQSQPASKPEGERPGQCGFAGCAVGWAAHGKLFRSFKINKAGKLRYGPDDDALRSWVAVDTVFGFTPSSIWFGSPEATHLFAAQSYPDDPTPKQVAKRIRAFVASNGAIP